MPKNTATKSAETTTDYKVTHGSVTRYEYDEGGNGRFVKYRAGSDNDTIRLTDAEFNRASKTFLQRAQAVPGSRQAGFVSTPAVAEFGTQQRGQYAPQGGKEGAILATGEPVSDAKEAAEADSTADDADGTDDLGMSELSAEDAKKLIEGFDDPEDVRAALKAEKAGKNRVTVVAAAEAKLGKPQKQ